MEGCKGGEGRTGDICNSINNKKDTASLLLLPYNLYPKHLSLKDYMLTKGTSVSRNTYTHAAVVSLVLEQSSRGQAKTAANVKYVLF